MRYLHALYAAPHRQVWPDSRVRRRTNTACKNMTGPMHIASAEVASGEICIHRSRPVLHASKRITLNLRPNMLPDVLIAKTVHAAAAVPHTALTRSGDVYSCRGGENCPAAIVSQFFGTREDLFGHSKQVQVHVTHERRFHSVRDCRQRAGVACRSRLRADRNVRLNALHA